MSTHEDLHRHLEVQPGSDRSFGLVIACACLVLGLIPLRHAQPPRLWVLALGGAFLLAALLRPSLLHTPNILWTRFGILLGRLVTPVILCVLYFLMVTPLALLMRLSGRRPLSLVFDPAASTYWIRRQPPGPEPESMANQF